MNTTTDTDAFEAARPDLLRLAYRMTGGRAEAEDIVQDAWLRWARSETGDIQNPRAWLSRTVARLSIDHLRKIKTRRETYVGPWLPEPVVTDMPVPTSEDPGHSIEIAQDVSWALMTVLETLKPEERAAFLLREAFEMPYPELAAALGKTEDACRQMVSRAKARLRDNRPRFEATDEEHETLLTAFADAARAGDVSALTRLLTPTATLTSDGGGKATAALRVMEGAEEIAKLTAHIAKTADAFEGETVPLRINGRPGFLIRTPEKIEVSYSIDVEDGRIAALYIMRNPDKLARLMDQPLGTA
ncbi:RNA polymerase sigma factor SigJ [Pyruvatibacter mobilis]|jgi:RNA polymerase sigma-70 factor (ECF subfamily)|uniref:Sigma-70 family RNA polymerase sigma factor n=1 Tax=Pyruvatibacter mobilis TaxID=1712261 RepID=A0A845Q831_9HYPH|nr:RNA polymerase sigma factor SigJ [Pyruvatibacter mobilis]NBG94587.1 sigma-70 family RNA polymerase sigma factor [Pyruvatibacter mobilis]QJD74102.1 RNA polymerase sigma factor SigJ [Pyruvatibacter mobilis]GGD04131.1 RNA polymerase sigma24 factor [Pyruvatibacter mobilis]